MPANIERNIGQVVLCTSDDKYRSVQKHRCGVRVTGYVEGPGGGEAIALWSEQRSRTNGFVTPAIGATTVERDAPCGQHRAIVP